MAISILFKAVTRRAMLPWNSVSSYKPVFKDVNSCSWTSSLLSKTFTSLGSRAGYCSKQDDSYPTRKLPDQSNLLTKVVFNHVRANDDKYQEDNSTLLKPIRKVLEIPRGYTFFECRYEDDVSYCYLDDFCYSYLAQFMEAVESTSGQRVSEIFIIEASTFKECIRSIMDSAVDALNVDCMINHIEKTEDYLFTNGTGCGIRVDLDELFKIRIWEKITSCDEKILDIIVCELKRNGFDFTEDPAAIHKINGAVERAMTRMTNEIKLNLPVPAGEPDMSTTISWGKCAGLPILKTIGVEPGSGTLHRLR
ncbi:hypothetical protein MKX03_028356 [Papaver bracteatum]|nr:hypothetical protein MKX03_028356 [Papaver bracteatum]